MSQMIHDLSPFLIKFTDGFGVRWYGLSYVVSFFFAYVLMSFLVSRQRSGLTSKHIGDFIVYIAFGTVIGGRLGYVLFYAPDLLWKFRADFPFWGVFAIGEGGTSVHGGILGVVVACMLYARASGASLLTLFDLCAVSGPLGIFFGRLANFVGGEMLGRPAPADFPLAVKFPQELHLWSLADDARLGPVVEKAGASLAQWTDLLSRAPSDPAAKEQVSNVIETVIAKIQDGDAVVRDLLAPMLTPRHPWALYAAFSQGLLLFFVLFLMCRGPRKPGFIAAMFVILYSAIGVADGFFREPDAMIGMQWLDLTRGQWLSLAMGVAGVVLLFWWTRLTTTTINGWGRMRSVRIGRR